MAGPVRILGNMPKRVCILLDAFAKKILGRLPAMCTSTRQTLQAGEGTHSRRRADRDWQRTQCLIHLVLFCCALVCRVNVCLLCHGLDGTTAYKLLQGGKEAKIEVETMDVGLRQHACIVEAGFRSGSRLVPGDPGPQLFRPGQAVHAIHVIQLVRRLGPISEWQVRDCETKCRSGIMRDDEAAFWSGISTWPALS